MDRNTRRFVAAAFVVAASCNVYDPSLLIGGGGSNASGAKGGKGSGASGAGGAGKGNGGTGDTAGSTVGGSTGSGGTAGNATGGTSGGTSGRGGSTGSGGVGATGGTGGTDPVAGAGDEGGEAGMGPVTGGASGTGGQGGGAGAAGKGGTSSGGAGAGGTAGTGGTGGAGSGGAGAGSGGTGGAVTATGCAKLTVPLNDSADQARFAISFSGNANLSAAGTKITTVLYVAAGNGGVVAPYVQDNAYNLLRRAASTALSGTGAWKTITWDVSTETMGTPAVSLTSIIRIGIQIWANGATTGLVNPSIVYIDSITVNTPSTSYPFTTTSTVYVTPTSSYENMPGIMWLNNYAEDTLPDTLPGTTLAWATTCP